MSRKAISAYALAGAMLLGATAYMVDRSHAIFREECRQRCDASSMDYKVRARPANTIVAEYPGECICVPRAPKRWWEIWR